MMVCLAEAFSFFTIKKKETNLAIFKGRIYAFVFFLFFLVFFLFFSKKNAFAEGKWVENAGAWQYEENGSLYKGWLFVNGAWYYLDPTTGNMKDGWIFDKETWYFLKTDSAEQGKMATGWTWVEGNCYYLKENGAMASNETVEGYQLAAEGQWVDKGQVVFEKEKGYAKSYSAYLLKQEGGQSAVQNPAGNGQAAFATKAIRGGGSGSGGSGGGGGASGGFGSGGGRLPSASSSGGSGASTSYSKSSATTGSHSASVDSTTNAPTKDKTDPKKEKGSTVEEKKEHQELPPVNEGQPEGKEETGKEKKDKHNEKREEKKEEEKKKEKTEEEHQRDADKVERALQKGENQNTAQYTAANGEIYTALFVQGVHIPNLKSTEEGGDFIEKEDSAYFTRVARFVRGQGYYDTNKARNGENQDVDRNLCFATTASNVLHWYLQENKEKIQEYIDEHGDVVRRVGQKNYSLQDFLNQSDPDQWNSQIFDYFKLIYGHRKNGFKTGPLVDLFINGYTPEKLVNSEEDFKTMDERGGFLYGVLGKKLQSDITGSLRFTFSTDVKERLSTGHALCISYSFGKYSHVVSLWGADFDESGNLAGIYVTDSDDQDETGEDPEVGLKYYRITYDENGWPYLNNSLSDKKGSRISDLHSFRWIE